MVRTKKKVAGIGAVCECLRRFLHPSKGIDEHFINTHHKHRIDSLVIVKREVTKVNKRDQMCYFYNHPSFPDRLIYSTARYAKVVEEGEPSGYFAENVPRVGTDSVVVEVVGQDGERGLAVPVVTSELGEDIARLRAEGYGVDDDNDPAPENIPANKPSASSKDKAEYREWNAQSTCNRKAEGHRHEDPKMSKPLGGNQCIDYFMYFLPVDFFKDVILTATNKSLMAGDGGQITWGEFVRYIGLWLIMSTVASGVDRKHFFNEQCSELLGRGTVAAVRVYGWVEV